jgi:hypothetical protein
VFTKAGLCRAVLDRLTAPTARYGLVVALLFSASTERKIALVCGRSCLVLLHLLTRILPLLGIDRL